MLTSPETRLCLEFRELACAPQGQSALRGINLSVHSGEFVMITGPNGAGKTTLCRCLALLLSPDAGEILVDGRPWKGKPWESVRRGVWVLLKGRRVFPELTVMENLCASPAFWKSPGRKERLETLLATFPRLAERRSQRAGTLSGGEQQILAIGRGILASPKILIVDEPSLGLSPIAIKEVYDALRLHRDGGGAVLVTEESDDSGRGLAQRVIRMEEGRIVEERPHPPGPLAGKRES